jgi:MFS family permease
VIGNLFFPPDLPDWLRQLQTLGIFAAGYLARPLGGIVMAHFGDLMGRKRMFMLSVLLMALPTLCMGLLPTYASIGVAAPLALLVLRVLQGAAVGGEVPGAWVFVSEHVPENRVGVACGTLTAGLTVGILFGSLVAGAVTSHWSPAEVLAWAWRIPFVLGGFFGLFAVWLRGYLQETPVFEEMKRRRELVAELPLKKVLSGHGRAVIMSMLLTWMLTAGIVVVILMTPTLAQKTFAIAGAEALHANSLATLCLTIGCLVFGFAADRFGERRVLVAGASLLLLSTALLYVVLASAPEYFALVYALAGFCTGVSGVVPVLMVRAFPPTIRFSGISFSYNIAYAVFGGLTPLIVGLWVHYMHGAPAIYVGLACIGGALGAFLARPLLSGRAIGGEPASAN